MMRRVLAITVTIIGVLLSFALMMRIILGLDDEPLRDVVNELTTDINCEDGVQFETSVPSAAYQRSVSNDVAALNDYWAINYEALFGRGYDNPCAVVEYDPLAFSYEQECGLPELDAAAQNAFYCGRIESVLWDGPTFFHPIYADVGPSAVTIIIAHEYGHYIQDRSGTYPESGFNIEMQADCYAGAFLGWAIETGYLPLESIDEVIRIMASFGQPRYAGLWTERSYGTSVQRNQAIRLGASDGPAACDIDFETEFGSPRFRPPSGNLPR